MTPRQAGGRAAEGTRLLIVCHGEGRGREGVFIEDVLAIMRETRPDLFARTRVYRTGGPVPDALPDLSAVLFWLADPVAEMYPACYDDAVRIAALARARGARLLNPPDALSNTIKSRQAAIWQRHGLPCAAAKTAPDRTALLRLLPKLRYPIVLRYDESHMQISMYVLRCLPHGIARAFKMRYPAVVLDFVDARAAWRAAGDDSLYAAHHHKKRAMVFGEIVFNNHLVFSPRPIVSSDASLFRQERTQLVRWLDRAGVRRSPLDEAIRADIDFALGPPEHAEVLVRAVRALGLDMAAVDYSSLPDGGLVIWEANPYFHLRHWEKMKAGAGRSMERRNPRFYHAAIDLLAAAAGMAGRPRDACILRAAPGDPAQTPGNMPDQRRDR